MTAGPNKSYQRVLVLLLSLNFGIVFFDRNAINYLMPFIKPDLDLSNLDVGALSAALALSWALAGLFVGRLSDRLQRRKIILVTCTVIFSCASLLSGLASGFAMLIAARLMMGIAEGGIMPLSQALIVANVAPERRGLAMGITQNFGANLIANLLWPLVLVAVATAMGWRHALLLAAVPGLIMAVLLQWLVREPKVPPSEEARVATAGIGDVLCYRNMILCIAMASALVGLLMIFSSFMPLILAALPGVGTAHMSWIMATVGFSAMVSAVLVTGASDRFGRRPVAIGGSLLGTFLPLSALVGTDLSQIVIMIAIGGASTAVFPIVMATIPSETVPPWALATGLGLTMGISEILGGVIAPLAAGAVADGYGLNALLWIMVALCLVSAILASFLSETAPARAPRAA